MDHFQSNQRHLVSKSLSKFYQSPDRFSQTRYKSRATVVEWVRVTTIPSTFKVQYIFYHQVTPLHFAVAKTGPATTYSCNRTICVDNSDLITLHMEMFTKMQLLYKPSCTKYTYWVCTYISRCGSARCSLLISWSSVRKQKKYVKGYI